MKETGLMFKAPLVCGILDDLKTQTRRAFSEHMMKQMRAAAAIGEVSHFLDEGRLQPNDLAYVQQFSSVGQPGDRIYVRETFGYGGDAYTPDIYFRASQPDAPIQGCWHPAIHMRKDDARLWLEVTGVRPERLQSISRGDAMAEGCPFPNIADGADPRKWFEEIWDSTGGDWAVNPWVWVIDFKRIEKPR